MFADFGFWELMLIGIIGLVVLGPERMPVAIRTIRRWINNVKRFSEGVKTELSEELRIQELHQNLKKAEQADMKNLSPEIAESVQHLKEAAELVTKPYQAKVEPFESPDNSEDNSSLANQLSETESNDNKKPSANEQSKQS